MRLTYLGQAIKVSDTVLLCTFSDSLAFSPQHSVTADLPGPSIDDGGHRACQIGCSLLDLIYLKHVGQLMHEKCSRFQYCRVMLASLCSPCCFLTLLLRNRFPTLLPH